MEFFSSLSLTDLSLLRTVHTLQWLVPHRHRPSQNCAYLGLSLTDLGLLRTVHTLQWLVPYRHRPSQDCAYIGLSQTQAFSSYPSLLYTNLDFDNNCQLLKRLARSHILTSFQILEQILLGFLLNFISFRFWILSSTCYCKYYFIISVPIHFCCRPGIKDVRMKVGK